MKRIVYLVLCFSLVCFFSGCHNKKTNRDFRDDEGYDKQNGFAASLTLDYEGFRKNYPEFSNEVCYYVMAQSKMPEDRKVIVCMENVYANDWHKAPAMEITSKGIEVSDEEWIFSFGKYFPVSVVTAMTGYASIDALLQNVGQVQKYEELGDFCAFSVARTDELREGRDELENYRETIYYGNANDPHSVEINISGLKERPEQSLQLTEKNVYYFLYDEGNLKDSSITIVQIPRDGGVVVTHKILYSDIGLPGKRNIEFRGNIFVDDDCVFFLCTYNLGTDKFEAGIDVVAYNLNAETYDVFNVEDADGTGKLFRYGEQLGVMTAQSDDEGYYTNLSVRFLNLDQSACRLSKAYTLSLALSDDWVYSFERGREFYCIGKTLCGIMTEKKNGSSYAYVEVDLESGAVETFIPFAKKAKQSNKGVYYGSILIRDDGRAVSEHNCS